MQSPTIQAHPLCNNAHMNWDSLRFVLALGRHGTLSAAAEALGVTHTTVGRRLGQLEASLGVRLFDRTPDGFLATEAGSELLELATALEERILKVEGRVRGQDHQLEGSLRVSTLDFLFQAFTDVFASFCERHPGVGLTVTSTETEVSLFRRQADVAFRMTNAAPPTLIGKRVGAIDFAVYGHRDLVGDTTDWAALPWLHWDEHLDDYCRWLDGWLHARAPGARIAMRLGENTLVRHAAVRQGIGVHPLPCFAGDRYEELVRVGPVLTEFRRELWLLYLPAMRRTRRVRAFVDHVADALADHPALRPAEEG